MTLLKSPIRSTSRSPLRGSLESRFGGIPNPLSISAPSFSALASAQPYDISAANSNLVTASDADAGGGDFTFTIAATGDGTPTITLATILGLVFSVGDGTADASMTFVCTVAEFNAAMDGATLQGGTEGASSITYSMTDGSNIALRVQGAQIFAALQTNTLSPADNATGVAFDFGTFTATFSRAIQAGTGNVTLKLVGGAAIETFNIATGIGDQGGAISISGADLIIAPNVNLTDNTAHAIQIAATAIDGAAIGSGDSFAGIADDTTWSFTCEDTTSTLSAPLDSATGGTTATASVSASVGHGTLYSVFYEGADPSHAQIVAGTDANDAAAPFATSLSVSAAGIQPTVNATGLTSETAYKTAFTQVSANGAVSTPVYADGFITDDVTAPQVSTLSPADGATSASVDSPLVMTFDESMARQGTVTLKLDGGATIETFDLSTDGVWSTVSETDDRWTGTPTSDFAFETDLAVRWSGLEDTSGNALPDNATDTTWNFTSAAEVTYVTPEMATSQFMGNPDGLDISDGSKNYTQDGSYFAWVASTAGAKEIGKYYYEFDLTFSSINSTVWGVIVQDSAADVENGGGAGGINVGLNDCVVIRSVSGYTPGVDGGNWSSESNGPTHTYADGDVMQLCIEVTASDIDVWVGVNNSFTGDPAAGTGPNARRSSVPVGGVSPGLVLFGSGNQMDIKSKASEQTYSAPTGFTAADDIVQDTATWVPAGGVNSRPFGIIQGETGEAGTGRLAAFTPVLTTATGARWSGRAAGMNFVTDSQNITVRASEIAIGLAAGTSHNGAYKADIIADGTVVTTLDFSGTNTHASVSKTHDFGSSTSREIEIVLPYSTTCQLLGVDTDSGSTNSPGTISRASDAVWMGDSIALGTGAGAASDVPSYQLASSKNWNVANIAVGGSVIAAADGTALGNLTADVYFVLSGYNDFLSQTNPTTYESTLDSFLSNFQTANSTAKLYFISPVGASSETGATYDLSEYRTAISDAVTTAGGNINYISGLDLLTYSGGSYIADGIHPNTTGYTTLVTALAPLVSV